MVGWLWWGGGGGHMLNKKDMSDGVTYRYFYVGCSYFAILGTRSRAMVFYFLYIYSAILSQGGFRGLIRINSFHSVTIVDIINQIHATPTHSDGYFLY